MSHGRQTYTDPILDRGLADPFILPAGGAYYLYGTGNAEDGRSLPIYRSQDLVTWEFVRGAVSQGLAGSWNRRNFWAPEVLALDVAHPPSGGPRTAEGGCPTFRFYLYYTASPDGTPKNTGNRVGLAVADDPAGPFEDRGVVVPHASLDGSPFRDADGALYLYYTAEFGTAPGMTPGRIYVDRLVAPDRAAGEVRELIGHHFWQEGPCMLRVPPGRQDAGGAGPLSLSGRGQGEGGALGGLRTCAPPPTVSPEGRGIGEHDRRAARYFLFYSTGSWGDATYCVRWAEGDSPLGPFREAQPLLLSTTCEVIGPGHHNFFRGPDGTDWIVYHAWDPAHRARFPRIDRLLWRDGRPWTAETVPGTVFGKGDEG